MFFVFISWLQDMLDKAESFFGKKQKFKLQQKGKTAAASAKLHRNSTWNTEFHWVVVSNIFYFHPYLVKVPILTSIFF